MTTGSMKFSAHHVSAKSLFTVTCTLLFSHHIFPHLGSPLSLLPFCSRSLTFHNLEFPPHTLALLPHPSIHIYQLLDLRQSQSCLSSGMPPRISKLRHMICFHQPQPANSHCRFILVQLLADPTTNISKQQIANMLAAWRKCLPDMTLLIFQSAQLD